MDPKKIWYLFLVGLSVTSFADANLFVSGLCISGCGTMALSCYGTAGFTIIAFSGKIQATTPALKMCNDAYDYCKSTCKSVAASIVNVDVSDKKNNNYQLI